MGAGPLNNEKGRTSVRPFQYDQECRLITVILIQRIDTIFGALRDRFGGDGEYFILTRYEGACFQVSPFLAFAGIVGILNLSSYTPTD